jgi:hypothetical protein
MSMFKIDEIAGVMVKSGRFKEAVPKIAAELELALAHRVITMREYFGPNGVFERICKVMLNPNDVDAIQKLGDDLIFIAIRIPDYVKKVPR